MRTRSSLVNIQSETPFLIQHNTERRLGRSQRATLITNGFTSHLPTSDWLKRLAVPLVGMLVDCWLEAWLTLFLKPTKIGN